MRLNSKGIISKINKKIDLEKNLSVYSAELLTNYYQYAQVGLSMNYYALYETLYDDNKYMEEHIINNINLLNEIIEKGIIREFDGEIREQCIIDIDKLRTEVLRKMDVVVDYIEKLLVYEYVLNRVEYRFDNSNSETGDRAVNDEEVAKNIFRYIFAVKDNLVVNDKIKLIVGQLPVRMAKTKFFDLIANSLSLYKGTDVASLESFLYTIRSSSTIYEAKGNSKYFKDIKKVINYLEGLDYVNIDADTYADARKKLDECTLKLNAYSDIYCAIQEVINKVYSILLSLPYCDGSGYSVEDSKLCVEIFTNINKMFKNKISENAFENSDDIEMWVNESFMSLEGKQENYYYECAMLESELLAIIDEHKDLIDSIMLSHQFECMKKCQLLLASSSFAELEGDANTEIIADEDYINNAKGRIISELSDLFADCSMPVRRAIMANVLNKLPVFFVNSNEAMQYISSSLAGCKDEAEKKASVDLINELIYNDEISYGDKEYDKFDFDGLDEEL